MKRLFTAALSAALLLSLALPSSAAGTGRAVDWALYTDITAQINGHPLRSYNVNGSTAVVAEDLRGYGFQVLWDAEDRTLSVVPGKIPYFRAFLPYDNQNNRKIKEKYK